ncbi:hypothetical protein EVG20_g350 [Dentipellis fragilis]|uniref:Uncharacterized protein n=1 Tax=Dentipellis fragilis TaxID=205917 RepID=A0A4Y9ZE05_9AGAM|nr:hypothetical protein EVG20_g350 [Dentipellis fragilis]
MRVMGDNCDLQGYLESVPVDMGARKLIEAAGEKSTAESEISAARDQQTFPSPPALARRTCSVPRPLSSAIPQASPLIAQSSQVLENIRRQSVEGLALPFLANWLLGDLTNLIGCILTHQLPFQTWLATYFCTVDLMLLSQYFYYRKTATPVPTFSRSGSRTFPSGLERSAPRYRTLSNVAANVAAVAALAAQQEETHGAPSYGRTRRPRHSSVDGRADYGDQEENEDEVDEEALAALADSFHSEGGRTGRRKHVAWSKERHPSAGRGHQSPTSPTLPSSLQFTAQNEELEALAARGRSLQRVEYGPEDTEDEEWRRVQDESQRRRSSRASRRGASMVFMGAWALFSIGTLARNGRGVAAPNSAPVGRVLSHVEMPSPTSVSSDPFITGDPPPAEAIALAFDQPLPGGGPDHEPPRYTPPSMERIIGRIFAWSCTTLYLTSRLPQIWKNFVRKSVEGLSMYLFVFAFLGNFFYVLSILSSPKIYLPPDEASAYINESIPYLLGSGGTLMFDVTIVMQSFIYRQHPQQHGHRGRRESVRARTHSEEEEGLLSAGASAMEDSTHAGRRRPLTSEMHPGQESAVESL